jgi:hypothetical protein
MTDGPLNIAPTAAFLERVDRDGWECASALGEWWSSRSATARCCWSRIAARPTSIMTSTASRSAAISPPPGLCPGGRSFVKPCLDGGRMFACANAPANGVCASSAPLPDRRADDKPTGSGQDRERAEHDKKNGFGHVCINVVFGGPGYAIKRRGRLPVACYWRQRW